MVAYLISWPNRDCDWQHTVLWGCTLIKVFLCEAFVKGHVTGLLLFWCHDVTF